MWIASLLTCAAVFIAWTTPYDLRSPPSCGHTTLLPIKNATIHIMNTSETSSRKSMAASAFLYFTCWAIITNHLSARYLCFRPNSMQMCTMYGVLTLLRSKIVNFIS